MDKIEAVILVLIMTATFLFGIWKHNRVPVTKSFDERQQVALEIILWCLIAIVITVVALTIYNQLL